MALHYTCDDHVVAEAIDKMKRWGRVAPDASFNKSLPQGLRKEIGYRDMDLLEYLGYSNEEDIVSKARRLLASNGMIPENAGYDAARFIDLRLEVKKKFQAEWGTITPALERMLYMFTSVRRPQRIAAIGIFWGNAFVWNIGSSCGKGKVYETKKIVGVDINPESAAKARNNIEKLDHTGHVEIVAADGLRFAADTADTFDYLYLDVGISAIEKTLNYDILKGMYDKLERGAWVVTHDTNHPFFSQSFRKYLDFVRDKDLFSESINFDFDPYGLELSIKK